MKRVFLSAIVVSLVCTSVFAAPVTIDNIYMAFGSNIQYYTAATQQFGFSSAVATGKLESANTPTPGTYDYQILNATFTFNPDQMSADQSSGGIAKATFVGGGTIQLTGDVKRLSDGVFIYTAQNLLTAAMTVPLTDTWLLQEQANYMVGSVNFDPTGGVLFSGDQLNMSQFRLAFKALPSPNPSNFTTNQKCLTQGIEITAVPVPEPATMVILGLGGLLLRRRLAA